MFRFWYLSNGSYLSWRSHSKGNGPQMKGKMLTAFGLLCKVFLILLAWRQLCFICIFGLVGTAELRLSLSLNDIDS